MAQIRIDTDEIADRIEESIKEKVDFDHLPDGARQTVQETIIDPLMASIDTFDVELQAKNITQRIVQESVDKASTQLNIVTILAQYMKVEED